jgi:hypothetical protein
MVVGSMRKQTAVLQLQQALLERVILLIWAEWVVILAQVWRASDLVLMVQESALE